MTAVGATKEFVRPPLTPALLEQAYAINVDYDLINASQAGSTEAFGQLYAIHVGAIRKRLGRLCGQNIALAEDLTQDTFLKAHTRIGQLKKKQNGAASWLHRIAGNLFIDNCRRAARIEFQSIDAIIESTDNLTGQAVDTSAYGATGPFDERIVKRIDLNRHIRDVFATMPTNFVDILLSICSNDLTYEEAADLLGIKLGTIRSGLHRGREIFKSHELPAGYRHYAAKEPLEEAG